MILKNILSHFYIFGSIVFMLYSQCIIKWRLDSAGTLPEGLNDKALFLLQFLMTPWVLSAIFATFMSGVFWIMALTRFELSYAYPWMALIFILMLFMSAIFFNETLSFGKLLGTTLVVIGLTLTVRG